MKLSTVIDTAIVIVCLPFYTVAVPFMWLCESLWQRRTIRLGQQVVHWPARDVREDFLAVDLTRIEAVGMFWIGRN